MRDDGRRQGCSATSRSRPNTRGRREDYPVNDAESPIAASMFNAVGGSTILYAAHFPRFHPSDFRVRSVDGVATTGRSTTARSSPTTT
jgi:choline dehydrogenase-like flavoprotein